MSKINDSLYVGNWADARNASQLLKLKISHVVCVASELKCPYPQEFKYLHIKAEDATGFQIYPYFDEAADFIQKAIQKEGGRVFIHCMWGISRSPTIAIAYLMKYHGMTAYQARKLVESKRPETFPNEGFLKQLEQYELMLTQIKAKDPKPEEIKLQETPLKKSVKFKEQVEELPVVINSPQKIVPQTTVTQTTSSRKERSRSPGRKNVPKDDVKKTSPPPRELTKSQPQPEQVKPEIIPKIEYRCKSCRFVLFTDLDVVKHRPRINTSEICTSIFIEQQKWMTKLTDKESKLNCPSPKCNAKLGEAIWSGSKCSCGYWTAPAFQIHRVKVDENKLGTTQLTKSFGRY